MEGFELDEVNGFVYAEGAETQNITAYKRGQPFYILLSAFLADVNRNIAEAKVATGVPANKHPALGVIAQLTANASKINYLLAPEPAIVDSQFGGVTRMYRCMVRPSVNQKIYRPSDTQTWKLNNGIYIRCR